MIIKNYTTFDVETANTRRDSICSLGVVRVENGEVVFSNEILINPECEFNYFNTRIHGITEEMVSDKPPFPDIWKDISHYFNNTVLIAHNAKSMDLCALFKTLERYNLATPNIEYICTYELAKSLIPKEESNSLSLDVLCNKFKITLATHHNALDDATACKELFEYFQKQYPMSIITKPYTRPSQGCNCTSHNKAHYSDKTIAMQELNKIVLNVILDGFVSESEASALLSWMESHDYLKGYYPFDKLFETISTILIDLKIDNDEQKVLLEILDAFINPSTNNNKINLEGKYICLSGDFAFGSKKEVEKYLIEKGANIASSVTKKVNILILGEAGSAAWKYGNYGSKYEKAKQLNEKGSEIVIYKEKDILGD